MAKKEVLDFTNVKDGGGQFTKKRLPAGDYPAKITKFEAVEVKSGENKGKRQWLFTIAVQGRHGATYPYYCQLQENALWKIRNLLVAAGKNVPKSRVAVDPELVVNKTIGITLDDADFEGRDQSEITAVFPASELDQTEMPDDDDDDDDDDEEEAPPAKKAKKKPAPVVDDDDDEDEDDEPEPPKKAKKKAKKAPEPDEDDEDDDLDELEVDDL